MNHPASAQLPAFPGAVGLTFLDVYSWTTMDGEHGGSPHVHLACSECYIVVSGTGRLETLTTSGIETVPLAPGDVVWFTPGTIHRTINDGALRILVVMQNGGLPEMGDAVLTFPFPHLQTTETYERAASLVEEDGRKSRSRARERRDLALAGFSELKERWLAGDHDIVTSFYEKAMLLVQPKIDLWRTAVELGALLEATEGMKRIEDIANGRPGHLTKAGVARIPRPAETQLGMCGELLAYDPIRRGD